MTAPNSIVARMGVAMHETPARGTLSHAQVKALLAPINPTRVLHLDGNSHVSQQDIRAHLIRVFGFGNYDLDVLDVSLIFEHSEVRTPKRGGQDYLGWDVAYRALVRLTIRNENGEYVAHYEDGSTATAQAQRSRGDAHDLAYKSAISLSVKRAAIALGDQFGLSLYNKGQQSALVKGTMVGLPPQERPEDVQEGIAQQVSLGNDEVDRTLSEDALPARVNTDTGEVEGGEPLDWVAQAKAVQPSPTAADELRHIWDTARDRQELTQAVKSAVLERKQYLDSLPAPAAEPTPEPEAPTTQEA